MDENKIKRIVLKLSIILAITFILECAYLIVGEIRNKERCGYDKFNILERMKCSNVRGDDQGATLPLSSFNFSLLNNSNLTQNGR
jgi:hypothetical protein